MGKCFIGRNLSYLVTATSSNIATAKGHRPFYLELISKSSTHSHLAQIHAHLIVTGHHSNIATSTKLIQRLSELGVVDHACRLFSTVDDPDTFLFNVLIRSLALNGSPASSISLYSRLLHGVPRLFPDNFTYAFTIGASSSLGLTWMGRSLHAHSIITGCEGDPFVGSTATDMYLTFSQVGVAEKVFNKITDPDAVAYNTFISGLVRNCSFLKALGVFEKMVRLGRLWDSTTLAAVLPVAAELQDLTFGMVVHCMAIKSGFSSLMFVVTGLISMYSKCGKMLDASFLFRSINGADLVAWNAVIAGFSFNGDVESSVNLLKELLNAGWKANSCTVLGLIPVSTPFGHEQLAQSIHGFGIKSGLHLNSSVCTALITVYSRLNDMESAQKLFDSMSDKRLISWNAIISGYTQNGRMEMAVSLFKQMQSLKIQPNPTTVTSILSASAQLGALTLGKWIHQIISEQDFEPNVFVLTAMIDMYAKCGSIEEAREIFDKMSEKNVVTWNTMIAGYGLHGHGSEALKLFRGMLNEHIVPTAITFLSVLNACSHSGLVEEGYMIFGSMESDHDIKPSPEHYACMVDLLGRAGKVEEALRFIETVPGNPGPGVWAALLGACMKYKNTKIARLASDKLFELEPNNTGHYVLLSNIHSASMNYSKAALIRQEVRSKNLAKTPGCTLIEIGNAVHVFTAGDRSHEQTEAIYSKLEALTAKLVEAGYWPITNAAFYDVEEEEKEQIVKVHSEKLAICFGLINTDPNAEIRIIKNLRVCLDCHSATKFISKVTKRVIVVRDANRFHHFRDGTCSCGDFW